MAVEVGTRLRSTSPLRLPLAVLALLALGCEGYYVLRGRTLAQVEPSSLSKLAGVVTDGELRELPEVTARLYFGPDRILGIFPIGRPKLMGELESQSQGDFEFSFYGDPLGTDNWIVVFSKSGYRTVEVDLTKPPADPNIRVRPCEQATFCRIIDVVMIPVGTP